MKHRFLSLVLAAVLLFGLAAPALPHAEAVTGVEIVAAALDVIGYHEGTYDSVNANDAGALSIGKLQWHASRALALMRDIVERDPDAALEILGTSLYNEILTTESSWSYRTLSSSEKERFAKLLATEVSIAVQDETAEADIGSYVLHGLSLQINSNAALVYYCDIENQYGQGGANNLVKKVKAYLEKDTIDSLREFHEALLEVTANYHSRRNATYAYCAALGWDTDGDPTPGKPILEHLQRIYPSGSEISFCWNETASTTDYAILIYKQKPDGEWQLFEHTYFVESGLTRTPADGEYMVTIRAYNNNYWVDAEHDWLHIDGSPVRFTVTSDPEYTPFDDVKPTAYYFEPVIWALNSGVTSGTGEATFGSSAKCTRAQVVTFLWIASGRPEINHADCGFTDVDPDAYYAEAVAWAVQNGITSGTGEGTFDPGKKVTRGQFVTFLWHAFGDPEAESEISFTDVAEDSYYTNAVRWAVEQGITSGTGADTFGPSDVCTRAQVVTLLYKAFTAEETAEE